MAQQAKPALERRAFKIEGLRIEARAQGKPPVITGHAAVFNQWSEDLGGFREQISKGAFAAAIGRDDVRALINHDPNLVLGRNLAGTLRLVEDAKGLAIEIDPPDTQAARDLLVSMQRGDITQMSFSFRTVEDSWDTIDGKPHRTVKEVQLYDVSPVTFPAYRQTDVGTRSLAEIAEAGQKALEAQAAVKLPPAPSELEQLRMRQRQAEAEG